MKQRLLTILTTTLLLAACAHAPEGNETSLAGLQNLSAGTGNISPEAAVTSHIRFRAISDTAMSVGAQGGLASAAEEINGRMEKDRWYLDTIYNFNGMMLSHGVLPPVLQQGNNTLALSDSTTLRISDKTYKILQQARFATTPPNWRDYLWMNYRKPEVPDRVLLPRNAEERKIWKKRVKEGWQKGIEQAYSMFQQNLARLKRDYNGMVLYRKLLQERMVSAPFVSRTDMGVTGGGDDMRVNDQVLRITVLPRLQANSARWRAIMVPTVPLSVETRHDS